MATEERDKTEDWVVPPERRPPSLFELQRQIDVTTGIARAAEEAALDIGAASLESAEQARRAAELAETSAEASLAAAKAATRLAPADGAPASRRAPASADSARASRGAAAPAGPAREEIPGSELPAGWSPVSAGPNDQRWFGRRSRPREGSEPVAKISLGTAPAATPRTAGQPEPFDERMVAFRERAERVMARLQRLESTQ
jgi:hypothetical protein